MTLVTEVHAVVTKKRPGSAINYSFNICALLLIYLYVCVAEKVSNRIFDYGGNTFKKYIVRSNKASSNIYNFELESGFFG